MPSAQLTDTDNLDVRQLLKILTAVKKGDFSVRMPIDQTGLAGKVADALNDIIELNQRMVQEFERISTVVGKEGKITQRASLGSAGGSWTDSMQSVNTLITDLVQPMAETSRVIRAVANGDLSQMIALEIDGSLLKGEFLQTGQIVNTMVAQLNSFASEVIRVAREVGTEGKLGGQAEVKGVAGTWKDLTDNVNLMAGNLTAQVRNIAEVTKAVANGDLSKKITVDVKGEILELKDTVNVMVDQLNSFASEVTRVAREVGSEGKLGVQADVRGVAGTWKDLTDSVNSMAGNLTAQVRNIAEVTKAVANGDLSKKITVDVRGEILELKNTINIMVDQLSSFASQVTRVAREVGTEGKLGGQAQVMGVAGTWKDLTDNVNSMASNLTAQVRGIAKIVTAVANGDLKRKLMLDAKGEIETLADTINEMIDTLATFADQVTTVAREVGIEGKLGGQAKVPGAAGTWRALTDNVNELAANLTTQVRAIAEVATAVTKGDLTRSISVEAQGEVAILKDNINQMIANLRETTQKNTEQDWLKTNLAKFTRMLQGQRDLETVSKLILSELAPLVGASHGVFYLMETGDHQSYLKLISTYAYRERKHISNRFHLGEGLVGQAAIEKQRILITEVPSAYIKINSGLGEASPLNVVELPVLFEGQVTAVIELASFRRFNEIHLTFFDQLTESIAIVLNTIAAAMRTEELLKQSQSLAEELQTQPNELRETNQRLEQQAKSLQTSEELLKKQQDQLQQTNEELKEKARLLSLQNEEVELKNSEIDQARMSLAEKAEQLALTSKYKSQFLANMSHELRTPLNSLLLLAGLLSQNNEGNLTSKQVEYTQTIYSAGNDLLALINDILDLAKIESGTIAIEIDQMLFSDLKEYLERTFRSVAQDKKLNFKVELAPSLPRAIYTDAKRLQQVLKNLLSNAFKFTERGEIRLWIETATSGWNPELNSLNRADMVIAFSVSDTGIGIPPEKHKIIFEAFQQADGTTSRKYGGTGLGLSISREIAQLLGGEITLLSNPGKGSTFTLYLPQLKNGVAKIGETQSGILAENLPTLLRLPVPNANAKQQVQKESDSIPDKITLPVSPSTPTPVPASPPPRVPASSSTASPPPRVPASSSHIPESNYQPLSDDRGQIQPGDRVVPIIEDDFNFAHVLLQMARETGFKGIIALQGETGLALAAQFQPDAIFLDIQLPVMNGWTVLDCLKHDAKTRHIPVYILTVIESEHQRGLKQGAVSYLQKPVTTAALSQALVNLKAFAERQVKNLLVVQADPTERDSIVELLSGNDVSITAVGKGVAALEALGQQRFDCIVLDLILPDMNGLELIKQIQQRVRSHQTQGLMFLPIIVYTDKELTQQETTALKQAIASIIIKDDQAIARLLDQTSLFLHRSKANLELEKQQMLERYHQSIPELAGKKVLIVDDDVRNVFALTSMLEYYRIQVVYADNGSNGIFMLQNTPDIDIVLMDVMMPEMDGYETMRTIRQMNQFHSLPIIALTAKAMQGDREKCIAAGASDYITKPVNMQQLLSLLRVWLYR